MKSTILILSVHFRADNDLIFFLNVSIIQSSKQCKIELIISPNPRSQHLQIPLFVQLKVQNSKILNLQLKQATNPHIREARTGKLLLHRFIKYTPVCSLRQQQVVNPVFVNHYCVQLLLTLCQIGVNSSQAILVCVGAILDCYKNIPLVLCSPIYVHELERLSLCQKAQGSSPQLGKHPLSWSVLKPDTEFLLGSIKYHIIECVILPSVLQRKIS